MYSLNENAVEDKLRRKFAEKFHVEIINFNDMSMALDVNFCILVNHILVSCLMENHKLNWKHF